MNNRNAQQGFTIIELMIAITLGMVLMGAALQFITSTRQTYELNDDVTRIQENGRLALDILVRDLQMAGYRYPDKITADGIQRPDFFQFENLGPNTFSADAADGGVVESDRIAVLYDPPPDDDSASETDCLGEYEDFGPNDLIANVYYIADPEGDGINSLYCDPINVTTGDAMGDPAPLVDGVDRMQALYRVSTEGVLPTDPTTYRYISADEITEADRANISAIRIALLVSNGMAEGSSEAKARKYHVLDSKLITTPATDRHSRRIYSTTVQFNNRSFE